MDSIGLMYYNARWYDPSLGRFAQADTIVPNPGNPLAFDRYAYVFNNPLKYSDPSGRNPCYGIGDPASRQACMDGYREGLKPKLRLPSPNFESPSVNSTSGNDTLTTIYSGNVENVSTDLGGPWMIVLFWSSPKITKSHRHSVEPALPVPDEVPIPLGPVPATVGLDASVNPFTGESSVSVHGGVGIPGNSAGVYIGLEGASPDAGYYGELGVPYGDPIVSAQVSFDGRNRTYSAGGNEWTHTSTGYHEGRYVLTTDQTMQNYGGYETFARRELGMGGNINWFLVATAPDPYFSAVTYYNPPIRLSK